MALDCPTQQDLPSRPADQDGSSASEREAKHIETITRSDVRDRDEDKSEQPDQEGAGHRDQDARVATMTRQAKEAGTGSKELAEPPNKDA